MSKHREVIAHSPTERSFATERLMPDYYSEEKGGSWIRWSRGAGSVSRLCLLEVKIFCRGVRDDFGINGHSVHTLFFDNHLKSKYIRWDVKNGWSRL